MHAFSPRQPLTLWRISLGAALLLSVAAAGVRAAEIYKSVDAQGHVVYSDQIDPSTPQSVVQVADSPSPSPSELPPRTLHFCWTNCFTLVLNEGVYSRVDGTEETWTIDRFTADSVRLHRHDAPADWNGGSTDVVYEGNVSNDRLVNITVNGKPVSGVDAAWGAALDTLPANNAERDHPAVSTNQAPPPLPDEEQPTNSEDGVLWTPGYWSWNGQRYEWMRGAWLLPPKLGLLWTPAYWGFTGGYYVFHRGYWGTQVGYYGGINYGYGYPGTGFVGGRWVGNAFAYNRAVSHVNTGILHNTYAEPVTETAGEHASGTRVSFSTGPGGTVVAPLPHLAQAPLQRENAEFSARLSAPRSSAIPAATPLATRAAYSTSGPAAGVGHRPATAKVAEMHEAAVAAGDGQSQRGSVNNAANSNAATSAAVMQATSKQTVTAKSLPRPIKPEHP